MLPACSVTPIRSLVGLPGAALPPHRLLYALYPNENSILLDNASFHVACQMRFGGVEQTAVSGACVAAPPSIQPLGFERQPMPLVPIHWDPEQPCCSSQNRFSLFRVVICHVRRRPSLSVEVSLRAWRAVLGAYVQAFGLPAFALANIPGTDVPLPYARPR